MEKSLRPQQTPPEKEIALQVVRQSEESQILFEQTSNYRDRIMHNPFALGGALLSSIIAIGVFKPETVSTAGAYTPNTISLSGPTGPTNSTGSTGSTGGTKSTGTTGTTNSTSNTGSSGSTGSTSSTGQASATGNTTSIPDGSISITTSTSTTEAIIGPCGPYPNLTPAQANTFHQGYWCAALDTNLQTVTCMNAVTGVYSKNNDMIESISATGKLGSRNINYVAILKRMQNWLGPTFLEACPEVTDNTVTVTLGRRLTGNMISRYKGKLLKATYSKLVVKPVGTSTTFRGNDSLDYEGYGFQEVTREGVLKLSSPLTNYAVKHSLWLLSATINSKPIIKNIPTPDIPGPLHAKHATQMYKISLAN